MRKLSWKPVRRGKVFCSPACGGDCLYSEFHKAVKNSQVLAKKLGKGWKTHVWENLGWHYSVVCGKVIVHPATFRKYYIAYFNGPQQFISENRNPCRAVLQVLEFAEKSVKEQTLANYELEEQLRR